jgi:hypothetical protein
MTECLVLLATSLVVTVVSEIVEIRIFEMMELAIRVVAVDMAQSW